MRIVLWNKYKETLSHMILEKQVSWLEVYILEKIQIFSIYIVPKYLIEFKINISSSCSAHLIIIWIHQWEIRVNS